MRRVMRFPAAAMVASDADVLQRFDMPAGAAIAPALRGLMQHAEQQLRELAEPRGVMQQITADEFNEIYHGDGRNAPESPLQLIAPRASSLALFVGTIGDAIGQEISRYFNDGDAASAMVLDAYASEAANRVAYALANEFGDEVLPYSPGYCGWHVSGQRKLFDAIAPDDIGVAINGSCLMTPIKSVSGVLVAGDAKVHRFRPAYAFCDECTAQDCVERMRSMIRR